MPWRPSDAKHKTEKASTPKKQALWVRIANRLLGKGASDESAIRQGNAVIGGMARRRKR